MRRVIFWATVLVLCGVHAIANEREARELNEQGSRDYSAGRYADAAEAFERADTLVPSADSATNAGISYLNAGQCEAARQVLQRLVDRSPEIGQHRDVHIVIEAMGRESGAPEARRCALVSRLLRAIDVARDREIPDESAEVDARQFADLGRQAYDAGRYAEAAQFYETAYASYPIDDALYNAAMAYHQAGQHRRALDAYWRFIAEGPDELRGSESVATVLQDASRDGERSEAETCLLVSRLRRAIASQAGETVTDVGEGRRLWRAALASYDAEENHQAAVFFECVQLVIQHPTVLLNAARCYATDHDWVSALRAFDQYFAARPEVAADPAVARARQAVEQEPYATDDRGMTLFSRLNWAVERAADRLDESTGGSP